MTNIAEGHIWVLNPGAERLLTAGTAANQRTLAQMKQRAALFAPLCAGEPMIFLDDLGSGKAEVRTGRALLWCPTPEARKACWAQGLVSQAAPEVDVLRRVLSKAFLSEALPERVPPHHRVIRSLAEYDGTRRELPMPLRAKRLDGYAGKGQRTLPRLELPGDRLWVEHNLRTCGLVVEAELSPLAEFSIHGVVTKAGSSIGQPCEIHIDQARAPLAVPTPRPDTPHAAEIRRLGSEAAAALDRAGYFGPFGLDLLLCEGGLYATDLNARFTLGFSAGLGDERSRALASLLDATDQGAEKVSG